MSVTKIIGKCPRDGREWDCQCARCGSSMAFEDCDNCGGEGFIEDDDWQADPGDGWDCDWCRGSGGHWVCLSSEQWCDAHPADGRADITRGMVEWFTFDQPPSADAVDPHAADSGTPSTRVKGSDV
jgi:hypothetical protein